MKDGTLYVVLQVIGIIVTAMGLIGLSRSLTAFWLISPPFATAIDYIAYIGLALFGLIILWLCHYNQSLDKSK